VGSDARPPITVELDVDELGAALAGLLTLRELGLVPPHAAREVASAQRRMTDALAASLGLVRASKLRSPAVD
jgi:hypothetical protein